MTLLLLHPEVAFRSCEECKAWLYDDKTGRKILRRGEPVPRPAGTPTPCWSCPKKSPDDAKHTELSEKNWKTLQLYYEVRGTYGARLAGVSDAIVNRNMGILWETFGHCERVLKLRDAAATAGFGRLC